MLIQLKLKNIALIEIIEINFEKGLNVLTGDSGSGKSLILDSLNVLFGGTNIPLNHLIRPGKDDCLIEAKFHPSAQISNWLINNGFQEKISELIIKRKSYKKNNKVLTKYFINNSLINKKLLEELGYFLIDFSGQSDSFLFGSHEYRRLIIDDLGSKESIETNLKIKDLWNKSEDLKELMRQKLEALHKQQENNLAAEEIFKVLDQAQLISSNEILELEKKEIRLANNLAIDNSIQEALQNLNHFNTEEQSVATLISQSIKNLNKICQFDIKISEFREKLLQIQNEVENLIVELNLYMQASETNDISLQDVQERLFCLKNLERTFSLDLPDLIKKRDKLKSYFLNKVKEEDLKKLDTQIKHLENNLNSLFIQQTLHRKQIAKNLQESVISILKNLGLENAQFLVDFEEVAPSQDGKDGIKFLFSANPDQKLAPLSKIISGGEMSRFLLAFKYIISKKPSTFFLDEIDNGLSGKSLFSLVQLIKELSQEKQILCITHQPFLAAAGKVHFKVKKNVINGQTFTSIVKLKTKEERQFELTELIGGSFVGAIEYASTLLDRAAA